MILPSLCSPLSDQMQVCAVALPGAGDGFQGYHLARQPWIDRGHVAWEGGVSFDTGGTFAVLCQWLYPRLGD